MLECELFHRFPQTVAYMSPKVVVIVISIMFHNALLLTLFGKIIKNIIYTSQTYSFFLIILIERTSRTRFRTSSRSSKAL